MAGRMVRSAACNRWRIMMDLSEKAKLARKLTHSLHQAPQNPQVFVNVLNQLLGGAGVHITELEITFGDLTLRLAERVREAERDTAPTFENLMDIAGTKMSLGRNPIRAVADVLGVSAKTLEDQRSHGRVRRAWLEKIRALPDLDETRADFHEDAKGIIEILAEKGYSPSAIRDAFGHIRTSRAGLAQIEKVVHGQQGQIDADELLRMQRDLFGNLPDAERRFHTWLATQLRSELPQSTAPARTFTAKQAEKVRTRFIRECELRKVDGVYRRVAEIADLIERPVRAARAANRSDDADRLRASLTRLFGDDFADRRDRRFSQLTGLDDRHAGDLIKGANPIGEAWLQFLDRIESALFAAEEQSQLRRAASF